MPSDWLSDSTFLNSINLRAIEQNELSVGNSTKKKGKKSQKSAEETKMNSTPKENSKAEKKTTRTSKKSEREPLKALNISVTPQKKSSTPAGKKATPAGKKATPSSGGKIRTKKEENPKIVVYTEFSNEQKQKAKKKEGSRATKSLDGLAQKRNPEGTKGKLSVGGEKQGRRSLNDLVTVKGLGPESKLPKIKPGDPEFEEIYLKIETLFPEVDPSFLKSQLAKFKGSFLNTKEFLFLKKDTGELPSRDQYLKRLETENLEKKVLEDFTVENYLSVIPNPWEHFLKKEKQTSLEYAAHSFHYLKNKYKKVPVKTIQDALIRNQYSLYLTEKEIQKKYPELKLRATNRSKFECDAGKPTTFDPRFIQEVAFVENEAKLRSHVRKEKMKKVRKAKETGTLLKCQSCLVFDLLPDDAVICSAGHAFCKDCIVKYVEVEINKEKIEFKCLIKCNENFQMEMLQNTFRPLVMDNIINRNQLIKEKDKGMKNLVCCPFCSYVTLMPPKTSVMKCMKPGCMMESCRYCKQSNHIPLQCLELDKFDNSILEEMKEEQGIDLDDNEKEEEEEEEEVSFELSCLVCNGKFVKKENSIQLECQCGAIMCFLCQKPYPECEHLNPDSSKANASTDSEELFSHNLLENEHEISSDETEALIEF